MSRWLITGATGLLGANAAIQLANDHEVIGSARSAPAGLGIEFIEADLADRVARQGMIGAARADVVLHTAALSSIEACQRDPGLAHALNVDASADLAAQAASAGSAFVYISTDAVFDGTSGGLRESSPPSPTSVYGRTKLDGENAVLDAHPGALIARVNFYGWSPSGTRSLAEFFFNALSRGESPSGFHDIVVSSLYVGILVEVLGELVEREARGVFHVVSSESTSKYELGRRIAEAFGYPPERIVRARSTDHLAIARGSRLDLSTAKMEKVLGRRAAGQQESIERLVADRRDGRPAAVASFRT